jgi:hypothetical protein
MKLQVFFTGNVLNLASLGIMSVTRGRYSHCGLLFTADKGEYDTYVKVPCGKRGIRPWNGGKYRFYFESWHDKDPYTHKTGVRGPIDFSKITDWVAESRKTRRLDICDVPSMSQLEILQTLQTCCTSVLKIKYAYYQLWRNWLLMRWGKGIPLSKRSPRKWTCSEFVVRALPEKMQVQHMMLGTYLYDEYAPSGIRGPSVKRLITEASKWVKKEEMVS